MNIIKLFISIIIILIVIEYDTFLRVVVSTANLLAVDYNQKTQGLWVQDFPKKSVEKEEVKSVKHNRENKLAKGFMSNLIFLIFLIIKFSYYLFLFFQT